MADEVELVDSDELHSEPAPESKEQQPPEQQETPADLDLKEQQPRKWADKYTSPDELEKGYKEAERKLTEIATQNAQMRQWIEQNAASLNQPQQQMPEATDDEFNPWDRNQLSKLATENAKQVAQQHYAQLRQMEKFAEANKQSVVAQYENLPQFKMAGRKFQAELAKVPDEILADPTKCQQAADYLFRTAVGDYYMNNPSVPTPQELASQASAQGVARPQGDGGSTFDLPDDGKAFLKNEFGLGDDAVKRIVERQRKAREA